MCEIKTIIFNLNAKPTNFIHHNLNHMYFSVHRLCLHLHCIFIRMNSWYSFVFVFELCVVVLCSVYSV